MHIPRWLVIGSVLFALTVTLSVGCTKSKGGPTGTIKGKVTYNAKPAPKGTVVQFSGSLGASNGTLADDGTFISQGVPVGTYQVSLIAPVAATAPKDAKVAMEMSQKAMQEGRDSAMPQAALPAKYLSPETSGETFDVKEGTNNFVLDMKD